MIKGGTISTREEAAAAVLADALFRVGGHWVRPSWVVSVGWDGSASTFRTSKAVYTAQPADLADAGHWLALGLAAVAGAERTDADDVGSLPIGIEYPTPGGIVDPVDPEPPIPFAFTSATIEFYGSVSGGTRSIRNHGFYDESVTSKVQCVSAEELSSLGLDPADVAFAFNRNSDTQTTSAYSIPGGTPEWTVRAHFSPAVQLPKLRIRMSNQFTNQLLFIRVTGHFGGQNVVLIDDFESRVASTGVTHTITFEHYL